MSLAEIEAELEKLTLEELRRLALESWRVFVDKEGRAGVADECSEDDPQLLAALDQAIAKANTAPGRGRSGREARAQLREWTSR